MPARANSSELPPVEVVAVSDLHGVLPPVHLFEAADLLILAGDLLPERGYRIDIAPEDSQRTQADYQTYWLRSKMAPWLDALPLPPERIIAVAGNHDWGLLWRESSGADRLPWTYLQDQEHEVAGLGIRVWGTPWISPFGDGDGGGWVFEAPESKLEAVFSLIPEGLDILVSHSPARGVLDYTLDYPSYAASTGRHEGSVALAERLAAMQQPPRAHVFGHIHEGAHQGGGHQRDDRGTESYNVSFMTALMERPKGWRPRRFQLAPR